MYIYIYIYIYIAACFLPSRQGGDTKTGAAILW